MKNRQPLKTHLIRMNINVEPSTFCQLDSVSHDAHPLAQEELSTPIILARATQDMAEIFSLANVDEPVMQELQRLCVLRRGIKLKNSA